MPWAAEELQFLATPPEDERIAALQAHDAATGAGVLEHQLVNAFLRHGLRAGGLAHGDLLGIPAREREHLVGDQPIVQDHVRVLQRSQCVQRQQARIARTCTDQHDGAAHRLLGLFQQLREHLFSRVGLAAPEARGDRPAHDGRVETSSRGKIRERELDALAPALQQAASVPSDSSSRLSSRSRTWRASTGATPPLEIAITSGERSTIAGTMKLESSASSTTLTRTLPLTCRRGDPGIDCERRWLRRRPARAGELRGIERERDPVDACPRRRGAEPRLSQTGRRCWSHSVSSGATSSTRAPASSSSRTLRSATSPPPTTSTRWPRRSANNGK